MTARIVQSTAQIVQSEFGTFEPVTEHEAPLPPPELTVVVPTYLEAGSVSPLVDALDRALAGIDWEVVFVDDDSPDCTMDVVRSIGARDRRVRGLRRIGRRGLAGAAIEGICASSAEFVAVMDCDLQHDERLLAGMLAALKSGFNLAVASRYAGGGSSRSGLNAKRQWGSQIATRLAHALLKANISDPMSGHFMMRRRDFDPIAPGLSTSGFKILLDILLAAPHPLKIKEFAYDFRARHAGQSKLDELVTAEFLSQIVTRSTGGLISPRFLMFGLVGLSGIIVHLMALRVLLHVTGFDFKTGQIAASYVAMTWNFFLNNIFTYRDRRLAGYAAVLGLLSFYLVCSVGTIANIGVAQLVYTSDANWLLAGVAGALMAAVFNFAMTSVFTWGNKE